MNVPPVPYLIAEACRQHRRHCHPHRRSTEHHHREPRGSSFNDFLVNLAPLVVLLSDRVRGAVPVAVPRRFPLRRGTRCRGDGARRTRGDRRLRVTHPMPDRAGCGRDRLRAAQRTVHVDPIVALLGAGAIIVERDSRAVPGGRRMADACLHGLVRHGRRPGRDRRHRPTWQRAHNKPSAVGRCSR